MNINHHSVIGALKQWTEIINNRITRQMKRGQTVGSSDIQLEMAKYGNFIYFDVVIFEH